MRKMHVPYFALVLALSLNSGAWAGGATDHSPSASQHGGAQHDNTRARWDYGDEHGPAHWADLDDAYSLCQTGRHQSPIALERPFQAAFTHVKVEWRATSWKITNDGRRIVLEGPLAGDMLVEEQSFALQSVEFHAPSEHTMNGRTFPAEVQFIHKNEEGQIAILAVMLEAGEKNSIFRSIARHAPDDIGTADLGLGQVVDLVPFRSRFYRYFGSLTTPPCTEGVLWTIMEDPIPVDEDDLDTLIDLVEENSRPVQPLNQRFLLAN